MTLSGQWDREIGVRLASRRWGLKPGMNEIGEGLKGRGLDDDEAGPDKGEANGLGLRRGVARKPRLKER